MAGAKPFRQITAAPGDPFWKTALETDVLQLAHDPSHRVHAVLDGAFFDDLPKLLDDRQLAARPLYGGDTPKALVEAGPWLIDLYHLPHEEPDEPPAPPEDETEAPDLSDEALAREAEVMAEVMRKAVEAGDDTGGLGPTPDEDAFPFGPPANPAAQVRALLQLVKEKPALVFWIGGEDLTHERLFKHLRLINKVLVPKDDGQPDEQEAVIFRHADGNVLASVLPVLDETQFARLFGPALALTFHAPDHPDEDGWPVRRAVMPLPTANPPSGMLALSAAQVQILYRRRNLPVFQQIHQWITDTMPVSSAYDREIDLATVAEFCELGIQDLNLAADQHLLDYCEILWAHGVEVRFDPRFQTIANRAALSREEKCRRLRTVFLP